MLKQIAFLICFLNLSIFACNPVQKKALLNEAKKLYQDNIALDSDISLKLKTLIQRKNQINIQGRVLNSAELAYIDKIESLEEDYSRLKKSIKEYVFLVSPENENKLNTSSKANAKEIFAEQQNLKSTMLRLKKEIEKNFEVEFKSL